MITGFMTIVLAAAVPLRWTVETSRAQPVVFEAYHGEELALEASFNSYGTPLELSGTPQLFWQTNGMGSAWWSTNAAVVATNRVRATFTGAMDAGADAVRGFLGFAGTNYRAAFALRLHASPGWEPAAIEWPYRMLDFEQIEVRNAPYYTKSETEAAIVAGVERGSIKTNEVNALIGLYDATNIAPRIATNAAAIARVAARCETNTAAIATNAAQIAAVREEYLPLTGGAISGSLAQGNDTTASGNYSHAEGEDTVADGSYSHVEGYNTTASGQYSHAEGDYATASGNFSHAEGYRTTASGNYSHAEGYRTTASGDYSHATGIDATASCIASRAEGRMAVASDDFAFAWNGDEDIEIEYGSHGNGTFNINPNGGASGFYIGETNFVAYFAPYATTNALMAAVGGLATTNALMAAIDHTAARFSNEVLQVATGISTNDLAALGELAGLPVGEGAAGLGAVLAALVAAVLALKRKLPYALNASSTAQDRAINVVSGVSMVVPDDFTDLVFRLTVEEGDEPSLTLPAAITTDLGDDLPSDAGEYLVSVTKTGEHEAVVKVLGLEAREEGD